MTIHRTTSEPTRPVWSILFLILIFTFNSEQNVVQSMCLSCHSFSFSFTIAWSHTKKHTAVLTVDHYHYHYHHLFYRYRPYVKYFFSISSSMLLLIILFHWIELNWLALSSVFSMNEWKMFSLAIQVVVVHVIRSYPIDHHWKTKITFILELISVLKRCLFETFFPCFVDLIIIWIFFGGRVL